MKLFAHSIRVLIFILSPILVSTPFLHAEESGTADEYFQWHPGNGIQVSDALHFGASYRLRAEFKDDFKFDDTKRGNDDEFLLHQLRLNAKFQPDDWVSGCFVTTTPLGIRSTPMAHDFQPSMKVLMRMWN